MEIIYWRIYTKSKTETDAEKLRGGKILKLRTAKTFLQQHAARPQLIQTTDEDPPQVYSQQEPADDIVPGVSLLPWKAVNKRDRKNKVHTAAFIQTGD